jgi:hypothetical protein
MTARLLLTVLEAVVRELSLRLESARRSLDEAQTRYDAAEAMHGRACSALGRAIEARS